MEAYFSSAVSIAAYIKTERETGRKFEFHNGDLYALAGGTLHHTILCGNVYAELRAALKHKNVDCKVYTSELKVHIKNNQKNSFVYPDATVVCGSVQTSDEDPNAVTNPKVIIEILSKSTADYDRGDKFHLYRALSSLQEYILVDQEKYVIDIYSKKENSDLWHIDRVEGVDHQLYLDSIDVKIPLESIYTDVFLS